MAKEGADYRTILTHYYTGVTVEPYTTAAMGCVGLSNILDSEF